MKKQLFAFFVGVLLLPNLSFAQITSLGGQTGATQTFSNDTNVIINSSGNIHTLGWSGLLDPSRGGTGADVSGFIDGAMLFNDGGVIGGTSSSGLIWNKTENAFTNDLPLTKEQSHFIQIANSTTSGISGGTLYLFSGNGAGNSNGGIVDINSGNADVDGNGGNVNLIPGDAGSGVGNGGDLFVQTGQGGLTSGNGGGVFFEAGSAHQDGDGDGGSISLKAGTGFDTGNGGNIILTPGLADGSGSGGNVVISSDSSGVGVVFDINLIDTSNKTFSFPNSSGTFSLLETSNTFTDPVNNFISASDSTVHIGSSSIPGCIVMGDTDAAGVTYITTLNGVISASSTPPGNCN